MSTGSTCGLESNTDDGYGGLRDSRVLDVIPDVVNFIDDVLIDPDQETSKMKIDWCLWLYLTLMLGVLALVSVVRNSVGSQELEGCGTGTLGGMAGGGPHRSQNQTYQVEVGVSDEKEEESSEGVKEAVETAAKGGDRHAGKYHTIDEE